MVVIGIGNSLRGDDAAGLVVARALAADARFTVHEYEGEGLGLLDLWHGHDAAVTVDTMRSGTRPGSIERFDALPQPLPAVLRHTSTHAVGLAEVIEFARSLGRLPAALIVYAIEGERFDAGSGLSMPVSASIEALTDLVREESAALLSAR